MRLAANEVRSKSGQKQMRLEANRARSKWGQIKIQDNPLLGARNAVTKFCSDPFCVASGARPAFRPLRAKSHSHRPRGSRQSVCHGHAPRAAAPSGEHLQCSKFGSMCKLAFGSNKHSCLIQIFPRFEPAALIGAQPHGTRSGASTEVSQGGESLQRRLLRCGNFC